MDPMSTNSTLVLRNMALTDALSMQRTMATLREAALTEIVKKLPSMNPDKMLEVLRSIDATSTLEAYTQLIEKIDEMNMVDRVSSSVGHSHKP